MAKARKKSAHPQVEMVPIDSLVPWDGNPRINDAAVGPVMRSMEAFGWTNPILARRKDRMVIAGHTRIKAARERGDQIVPVIFLSFTSAEARLYSIADNQLSSIATWDTQKRNTAMRDLLALNMDLSLTGFDKGELRVMTREGAGGDSFDTEEALKEGECRCERGQVWLCGDHRVMCGDSTEAEDVARLMAGEKAAAVVTDPPFTFGLASTIADHAKAGSWHDLMNTAQWFRTVYRDAGMVIGHNGPLWICTNWRTLPVVMRAATDEKMAIQSVAVWDKEWIGPGGSRGLRPSYEMVALITLGNYAIPDRGIADVWRCPASSHKPTGHAAEKPVSLFVKCLEAGASKSAYDPFLGSGTTMIAAERLGRRAFGMEIEPRYVHVSLARWEAETGGKAELLA